MLEPHQAVLIEVLRACTRWIPRLSRYFPTTDKMNRLGDLVHQIGIRSIQQTLPLSPVEDGQSSAKVVGVGGAPVPEANVAGSEDSGRDGRELSPGRRGQAHLHPHLRFGGQAPEKRRSPAAPPPAGPPMDWSPRSSDHENRSTLPWTYPHVHEDRHRDNAHRIHSHERGRPESIRASGDALA